MYTLCGESATAAVYPTYIIDGNCAIIFFLYIVCVSIGNNVINDDWDDDPLQIHRVDGSRMWSYKLYDCCNSGCRIRLKFEKKICFQNYTILAVEKVKILIRVRRCVFVPELKSRFLQSCTSESIDDMVPGRCVYKNFKNFNYLYDSKIIYRFE